MWKYIPPVVGVLLGQIVQHSGVLEFIDPKRLVEPVMNPAILTYGLSVVCLLWLAFLVYRDEVQKRVRYFDMPIRDAVDHLVRTVPHSFNNSGDADRHFLDLMHRQMCSGRLLAIGTEGVVGPT